MPVNDIAFTTLNQPSPTKSFLNSYADAEAKRRQAAQDQAQSQDQAQARKLQAIDQLGAALDGIPDGDAQGFERVKGWAVQNGLIDPNEAQRYTVEQLPQIRAMSQQARQIAAQRQKSQMDQQEFGLKSRVAEAQIGSENAQAAKYRADAANVGRGGGAGGLGNPPQHYQWVHGADGSVQLAPITGGAADPNRIAPGEGVKVRASNAQLDALEQSLTTYLRDLDKTSAIGRVVSRGPEVSKVETGHTDLLMQMKNLYELGVLNGPDYMLMTKIVEDPTSMMQLARGTEGLKAQADTVKSIISRSRNINNAKLGLSPSGPSQPGAVQSQAPQQQGPGAIPPPPPGARIIR
jgi:hypothetical protein